MTRKDEKVDEEHFPNYISIVCIGWQSYGGGHIHINVLLSVKFFEHDELLVFFFFDICIVLLYSPAG